MSLTQYPWDLEERAEDAIVAHLKNTVPSVAMVIPAKTVIQARYPLVVVEAQQSDNKNDTAPFTGKRRFNVRVAMAIEAINNNGEIGSLESLETARERFRNVKSPILGALAGNELHDLLNDSGVDGILFSQAHLTTVLSDAGDGKITMEATLDVIAQPKEL